MDARWDGCVYSVGQETDDWNSSSGWMNGVAMLVRHLQIFQWPRDTRACFGVDGFSKPFLAMPHGHDWRGFRQAPLGARSPAAWELTDATHTLSASASLPTLSPSSRSLTDGLT
eukprot:4104779-Prymnesium_polylepis.1